MSPEALPVERTYVVGGLRLGSDIELALPTLEDHEPGMNDLDDVEIRLGDPCVESHEYPDGDVLAAHDLNDEWWYVAVARGDDYFIRFRGCGEFRIGSGLDVIEVRPDPAGRSELLPILLAGTVLAFLLTLLERTVIHASACTFGAAATAFVGHTGHGKSTLAALMCSRGAALVTDDVLVVDAGPPAMCVGGSLELRLRSTAASIATDIPRSRVRTTSDGRHATTVRTTALAATALGCVIVPIPSRQVDDLRVRLIEPGQAVFALLACPRVHGWRRSEILVRDFDTLSALVNEVPVYEAVIPWGPPFREDVVDGVAALAGAATPPFAT